MVAGGYATRGTVTCADARRLGVTPRWSSALAKAVYKTNQQTARPYFFYDFYSYSRRSLTFPSLQTCLFFFPTLAFLFLLLLLPPFYTFFHTISRLSYFFTFEFLCDTFPCCFNVTLSHCKLFEKLGEKERDGTEGGME